MRALATVKDGVGNEQQWGYCTWLAKNDMEEITITMHSQATSKALAATSKKVTWIATGAELNICNTEPAPTEAVASWGGRHGFFCCASTRTTSLSCSFGPHLSTWP